MNEFMRIDPSDYLITRLSSAEEATAIASFPVKFPRQIPSGFTLESLRHLWPPHVAAEGRARKVHADYVVADYTDIEGNLLQVIQGFTGRFIAWATRNPPPDLGSTVSINGRQAHWLTGVPRGSDKGPIWEDAGFSYVGWQDGVHPAPEGGVGDSPRYFGLVSDHLTIDNLIGIAKSVPSTPFVTVP